MSTSSMEAGEYLLRRQSATAFAVSIEVRQGTLRSTALRRILTLSRLGRRPLVDVDMT